MHISRKHLRLVVSASLIGNALEWYEFYLFIHFTPIFTLLFFPNYSHEAAIVGTFMIFSFGFISRPFGTMIFGHIGDKFGRRIALISSILLMTVPTVCIGFLPTYAQVGLFAAILMAFMRFLQGISTGGEQTGAMCYLTEFAPPGKRGIMGSWTFFGSQVGAIVSIIEFLFLEKYASEKSLIEWGWRLTFIAGGAIGLLGWYLRKKLKETPPFLALERAKKTEILPIFETFKNYKIPILKAILLSALPLTGWYMVFIYAPVYSSQILQRDFTQQMLILLAMIILSNIAMPLFGILGDKGYTRLLWMLGSLAGVLLAVPIFSVHESLVVEILFRALAAIFFSMQYALLPMLICSLFPAPIRYTGVGISFNLCNVFLGGGAPIFTLALSRVTENYLIPILLLIGTSLLSALVLLVIREPEPEN